MTTRLELSLPAVPVSVREVRTAVGEIVANLGAPERAVEDVRLCVSEAATNVVRYAYEDHAGALSVWVEHENDELTVVVRDDGAGMDDFHRDGDLGYGLRIIDELSERCVISSAPGTGTEVRMTFAIDDPSREGSE